MIESGPSISDSIRRCTICKQPIEHLPAKRKTCGHPRCVRRNRQLRAWPLREKPLVDKTVRVATNPRTEMMLVWNAAPPMTQNQRVMYVAIRTGNTVGATISTLRALGVLRH